MEAIKNFLLYPLITFEGLELCLLNILIFIALILLGLLLLRYSGRYFRKQKNVSKKFTVEGKDIPVLRLTRQLIWIALIYLGFKTLSINNPELDLSAVLTFEFIRFDKFYIAVYHIFFLLVIYFGGRIILSIIRIYLIRRAKHRNKADEGSEYVYFQLLKYVTISLGIILMLRSMGVELSTFMESILFLSVGVALGMQDIFKDFFAGLLLLFEGKVKVGDIVEIDRMNEENFVAKILEINVRTSQVETRDGKTLIIPNSHLTFEKVNNWSTGQQITRFMIPVEVGFAADLDLVKKILIDCATNHPKIINRRDVIVRLLNFGDNGYKLDVVFWANKNFFIEIYKSDIRFAIDQEFRKHGIKYPYNQLDVHMLPSATKFSIENKESG